MPIQISPVTPEQYETVLPMIADYQRFYEVEDIDEARNRAFFIRFLAPSEKGRLLGAWEGEELLGFACLYWHASSLTATDTVLMYDLFVAESARGKGVGRALIEEGRRIARDRGASHLVWSTAPDNHRAQALYDSTGAEKSTWLEYELEA